MDIISSISTTLAIPKMSVKNCIDLIEDGSTIPFIARYRKEMTGSLDEVAIGDIVKEYTRLTELEKRKASIVKAIDDQGKLTKALEKKIIGCTTSTLLEDLYLPYKVKRKTRATKARENGLQGLADILLDQIASNLEKEVEKFINEHVPDNDAALAGASDIVAEVVSENVENRQQIRKLFKTSAEVSATVVKGKDKEGEKYRDYFDFSQDIATVPSHRVLALFRAEREKIVRLDLAADAERAQKLLEAQMLKKGASPQTRDYMKSAIQDSYKRLIKPSIESEFRNELKAKADQDAIAVFADNVRELLLESPLGQKVILAVDPGYRTGCKIVVLDNRGELVANTAIFPHEPQKRKSEALSVVEALIKKYSVEVIAVGNGTAGRESEQWLKSEIKGIPIFLISEQGASIYSASEIAREEFPDYDVTVRGAVSIGRRLADPLAELVKIDPKSVGVGQYQHDVDQKELKETLGTVVESCVNSVGVNINSASRYLLEHVSGIGPALAKNIVAYRSEYGLFKKRSELKKVPKMGAKAYQMCAGFLRISGGVQPLDETAVHPESYPIVKKMASDLDTTLKKLVKDPTLISKIDLKQYVSEKVGLPTLKDIVSELKQPGRDPRSEFEMFSFSNVVQTIGDVSEGMVLPGVITNVTKFGAFVDFGIKENGLVHISKLADGFVSDPADVVKVNQKVEVTVVEVDQERKRIALSMVG